MPIVDIRYEPKGQENGARCQESPSYLTSLKALRCTNSDGDPGVNLEIFGEIEARGVFLDGQGDPQAGFREVLWEEADGKNVAEDTEIVVNKSIEFLVFDRDFL